MRERAPRLARLVRGPRPPREAVAHCNGRRSAARRWRYPRSHATPRPVTKLSKEEQGAVPATSDSPVPYQLRDSGLPDFSSAGPSTASSCASPLTLRLSDIDTSGDAPPAYEHVMAAPGVVDEPYCASTWSAPAYAGSSETSLTSQRGASRLMRRLFRRRGSEQAGGAERPTAKGSEVNGGEAPPSWLESVTEKK